MSAMRMFAAAAFASVDERAVFGRCLPRWEIARFVSTFTRPPATWSVGGHPLLVPPWLSAMRSVARVRNWWVCTNDGCIWGCPQGGVGPGPRFSWVRCWSSSGGRVCRCMRAYSTSGTRLSSRSTHRRCCCPRNLCGPSLTGRVPPGGSAWGFHGCAPMMGAVVVVRNAE